MERKAARKPLMSTLDTIQQMVVLDASRKRTSCRSRPCTVAASSVLSHPQSLQIATPLGRSGRRGGNARVAVLRGAVIVIDGERFAYVGRSPPFRSPSTRTSTPEEPPRPRLRRFAHAPPFAGLRESEFTAGCKARPTSRSPRLRRHRVDRARDARGDGGGAGGKRVRARRHDVRYGRRRPRRRAGTG